MFFMSTAAAAQLSQEAAAVQQLDNLKDDNSAAILRHDV
jgi:hypothetical protein